MLTKPFQEYGLELRNFFVESLSLPEELQAHLDKAASMRLVGDLNKYTQFQTAEAISVAAANPGGLAGACVGLGAGLSMAQAMTGQLAGAMNNGGNHAAGDDPLAVLERLHDMVAKGIVTQAEYDAKKAELLGKIR